MLERRLKALKLFGRKPMPDWGSDLSGIDFQNIKYFVRSTEAQAPRGRTCPTTSRTPTTGSASRRRRSSACLGVAAQYESEVVYHQIQKELEDQGVDLPGHRLGLKEHPRSSRSTSAR
jgi:Fe-S cluster assembly protein SufB